MILYGRDAYPYASISDAGQNGMHAERELGVIGDQCRVIRGRDERMILIFGRDAISDASLHAHDRIT